MTQEAVTDDRAERLTRRQAAADIAAVIVLVPLAAVGAGLVIGYFSSGAPSFAAVVLIQALLVLAGVYLLLERREQRFSQIGLKPPRGRDVGRAVLVLLASFALNALLTVAIFASSPSTLDDHLAGLESLALGLTAGMPLAGTLALLLLVGFYEEILARGLLLTRIRQLVGGFWAPSVISALLFALGHFYQGVYGVVQTALLGFVLAVFTLRWGTLWPAIFAHSAINMLSVLQLGELGLAQ
jgi:uncharacterized protein